MKLLSKRSVIFPVFVLASTIPSLAAGIVYTCDPGIDAVVPGTCAYLNSTIAGLYNSTFSNANASIYVRYGTTELGASTVGFDNQVPWAAYVAALTANANASGNAVQLSAVKALNSLDATLYSGGNIDIPSALGTALGFAGLFGTSAGGTACTTPGTATCYNGIITLSNAPGAFYYRTGTEGPKQYDFYSTVEHETDEVLGTASCVETTGPALADECPGTNIPAAVDLYRYQSAGNLVLISLTPGAYFSYNGGQANGANGKVYNTLDNGDDYGDFLSSSPCQTAQSIQDAEGCPGQDHGLDITNDGGAEINILNAVGYNRNAQAATPPVISNLLNGATGQSTMAAGTYGAIYGTGLSTTSPGRQWATRDFTTNANGTLNLPTSLDGTSVTVNNVPAYIFYISPTQVNIITPTTAGTGNGVPVIVSLNGQQSAVFSATVQNLAPSFFAFDPGTADNGKYLIAQHAATSAFVGKVGLFPGTSPTFTTPAVPGETIVLIGTGFGPTSPVIAPGIVTDKIYNLSPTPTATLGGIAAQVSFAGLAPGYGDVYQFNVVVPPSSPNADLPFIVNIDGTLSWSGQITVQAQ